jgi:hypothetical protein
MTTISIIAYVLVTIDLMVMFWAFGELIRLVNQMGK